MTFHVSVARSLDRDLIMKRSSLAVSVVRIPDSSADFNEIRCLRVCGKVIAAIIQNGMLSTLPALVVDTFRPLVRYIWVDYL
jgi:hypothetical protein